MTATDEQIRETTLKRYALVMDNFGNREMVERPNGEWVHYEDVLSKQPEPLLKMYVGMEWVLEQEGNPWDGMLVKCVDERDNIAPEHEQVAYTMPTVTLELNPCRHNVGDGKLYEKCFIVQCIDPAFWTGEIEGEQVRCYENDDGYYTIRSVKSLVFSSLTPDNPNNSITSKLMLSAIKSAGIPIMPYSQSNGQYDPPSERE